MKFYDTDPEIDTGPPLTIAAKIAIRETAINSRIVATMVDDAYTLG